MIKDIKRVAIIGVGSMGSGIAHVFALSGYDTIIADVNSEFLEKGLNAIKTNMSRQVKKGVIIQDVMDNALQRIIPIADLNNLPDNIDLIIEAVNENKELKVNIYNEIVNNISSNTIIATNTSSISITELAPKGREDKFIGMHFMNPVPLMQLVEIIRGHSTSDETFNLVKDLSEDLGKVPVEVNDYPGFISNRILIPMINEAIYCLYEGVANAEDIDTVMKLGMNHPMGPLTLADFIGLDVCLSIMEVLYNGFNDSKYRPCPLLKKMVAAGKLGRKTKEGFFRYV